MIQGPMTHHALLRSLPRAAALLLLFTAPASGCDDDTGMDASSTSGSSSGGAGCGPNDSTNGHAADIQPIWDQWCTRVGCHTGSPGAFNLSLDEGYAATVDVPSNQVASMMLVAPGDVEGSYLWHKINGTADTVMGGGQPMPNGEAQPLSELDPGATELIRTWIACGAPE